MNTFDLSSNQQRKQQYLEDFREFRDTYLDILPRGILLPENTNYQKHKCRTVFFNNISLRIGLLIDNGVLLSDPLFENFFQYMEHERDWQERATPEDIELINKVLDKAIGLLESQKS